LVSIESPCMTSY